ncbi:MAG: hypothetical protein ACK5HO_05950 [Pseudomonadota bacterium]|jgi:hypothetical protein
MPRKIKKQDAVTLVKSVDELEIQYDIILRTVPPAKKRERQRAINALLDSYIRDERDILVLVIKVK